LGKNYEGFYFKYHFGDSLDSPERVRHKPLFMQAQHITQRETGHIELPKREKSKLCETLKNEQELE
jgi:hypothetical protein